MKSRCRLFCFVLAASGLFTMPAYAYLDPGTGSIILQGLLAVIAGGLVWMSAFWSKFKSFFRKSDPTGPDAPKR